MVSWGERGWGLDDETHPRKGCQWREYGIPRWETARAGQQPKAIVHGPARSSTAVSGGRVGQARVHSEASMRATRPRGEIGLHDQVSIVT